jgi:hypothetical protein
LLCAPTLKLRALTCRCASSVCTSGRGVLPNLSPQVCELGCHKRKHLRAGIEKRHGERAGFYEVECGHTAYSRMTIFRSKSSRRCTTECVRVFLHISPPSHGLCFGTIADGWKSCTPGRRGFDARGNSIDLTNGDPIRTALKKTASYLHDFWGGCIEK